ncbi:kinase-like protein [Hypoxylon rubiginosum]|uniref:Kinase-like protein n=1 Tax=Hypoxylon rubiginosum TaxID=110542 RepID=A0ACB9YZK9_9PEZI|nr:kinase-like protein [Hypoxylon rubiginosum]
MDSSETTRSAATATDGWLAVEPSQDDIGEIIVYDSFGLDLIEGIENVQRYNKGGYHPVHLDDIIDGRFEVVHKLGSGGFGIVWLCRDITTEKWRAVKIMAADHSTKKTEENILNRLRDRCTLKELDDNHIVVPLEQFWLEGPNGRHLCLVMPVLGMTVSDWRRNQDDHEEETGVEAKNVCSQIIQSLSFLHSHGICHGDFKPANILMKIDGIDDFSKDEIIEMMGDPDCYEFGTASGQPLTSRAPEYCVCAPGQYWSKELSTKSIAVIDFGESFFIENPPESTGIPSQYGAPEVLFGAETSLGYPSDVWSLACTLFEVRTDGQLFRPLDNDGFKGTIQQMEFYVGPLPQRYQKAYLEMYRRARGRSPANEQSKETHSTTSDALPKMELKPITWKLDDFTKERNEFIEGTGYLDIFEAALGREFTGYRSSETFKYRYPREDVLELADLLRKMLKYNPTDRINVDAIMAVTKT